MVVALAGCESEEADMDRSGARPAAFNRGESEEELPSVSEKMLSGPMLGVYKYTDNRGVIHYVDSIRKVPRKYRKKAHHPTGGAVTILPSSSIDDLVEKHGLDPKSFQSGSKKSGSKKGQQHGKVVLYTTQWCPACKRARAYLRQRGVAFVERDVERNRSNLEEMLRKSGGARGVPVIDVRGTVMRGFNSHALDQALKH
jgi:glutaredoxin-like YruB-family protein